jgi:hypothetical protein
MKNTLPYDKLPALVNNGIKSLTGNSPLLVKQKLDTPNNKPLNCHYNVANQIESFGGSLLNGWLLTKKSSLVNRGIWRWTYHSVWLKTHEECYDITKDKDNSRDYSTFVPDNNRKINLKVGITYNDILIIENKELSDAYNETGIYDFEVKVGIPYWVLPDLSRIRDTKSFDGMYRLIRPEFPINSKILEEQYDLKIINGKLVSNTGTQEVNSNMLFEFSLSGGH